MPLRYLSVSFQKNILIGHMDINRKCDAYDYFTLKVLS